MFLGLKAGTTCVTGCYSTMVPLGYKNEEAFLLIPEIPFLLVGLDPDPKGGDHSLAGKKGSNLLVRLRTRGPFMFEVVIRFQSGVVFGLICFR